MPASSTTASATTAPAGPETPRRHDPLPDVTDRGVTDMSETRFKLVFECASALRTLADVLANMLDNVQIDVWKTEAFRGVKIVTMDPKQISLVVSELHANVEMDCEHTTFRVDTKLFSTCVKSAPQHYAVSVESLAGSSSVRIMAYESLSNTSVTKFTLPTLVCDQPPINFRDIEYKTFIDMETSELKSIVGMCLKLEGKEITLRVQQLAGSSASPDAKKRPRHDRKHMVLTLLSDGTCQSEHTFYSYVEECGDTCVAGRCDAVSHVPADEELETTYEEVFGARHIADFLRSIDKNVVTLRLKADNPLILHHKFGSEDSFVSLVVAPHVPAEAH